MGGSILLRDFADVIAFRSGDQLVAQQRGIFIREGAFIILVVRALIQYLRTGFLRGDRLSRLRIVNEDTQFIGHSACDTTDLEPAASDPLAPIGGRGEEVRDIAIYRL